jgi:carboxymethylenebutenolidase
MGKTIQLAASDGHKLSAYRAEPAGKPKGGLVVAMEIFGVNSHIRGVADGYAADGYLVIAPALFDRVQPNYDTGYSQEEIQKGIGIIQKINLDDTMKDVAAAVQNIAPRTRSASSVTAGAHSRLASDARPGVRTCYGGAPGLTG